MKKRIIFIGFAAVVLVVGLLLCLGQRRAQLRELYYSGTIEATQAHLAFQARGRVVRVLVDEGEAVDKDQLLAELDRSEFQARYEEAQARFEESVRNFQRLETVFEIYQRTLPSEVARAAAGVRALRAQLNELESGYRDQDVERARLALLRTEAVMEEARKNKARYDKLFQRGIVSEKQCDAVSLKYETSFKEYERAKEAFDLLKEGVRKETIQTARARLAEGEAILTQAQSNLDKIKAAERDVEAAKARIQAVKAAVELAEIQLKYAQLRTPFNGIITTRSVEPGEVVLPCHEVLTLSDLSTVDLKIFVDEAEIGKVKPGQEVEVRVDTFPNKSYAGRVSFISSEGEFTPKIIQTRKERVTLVYLVKVSIPNAALELKPGMPADAWLR